MNRNDNLSQRLLTAEQGVLGSMLIDESVVGPMLLAVSEEDFQVPANRNIFRAFRELYELGRSPDPILVNEHLGGTCDKLMMDLMEVTPTAANADEYAKALREASRLWRLRDTGGKLAQASTMADAVETVEAINNLVTIHRKAEAVTAHEAAADFMRRMSSKRKPEYLSLGMKELDKKLYLELGDFVLLGGYSSAGKTLLSLQFALALTEKYRVGYFTLETNPRKLTDRLVAHMAQVPLSLIKECRLEGEDARRASEAARRLDKLSLDLIPASGMTVRDIQAITLNKRYQVIFVDYLQIISAKGKDRYEQVTNISIGLHTLSQSHGVSVFALAQLSRPEKNKAGLPIPPSMSSFRESGQLEQDADVALILLPADPNNYQSGRVLKIAKNKDGERSDLALDFNGATQTLSIAPKDGKAVAAYYTAVGRKAKQCRAGEQMGFQDLPNDNSPLPF